MGRRFKARAPRRHYAAETSGDQREGEQPGAEGDGVIDGEGEDEDEGDDAEGDGMDGEDEGDDAEGDDAEGEEGADPKAARAAERKRCQQLTALQAQADRLGVKFNASRAIERGMSVTAARRKIMDAAADAGSGDISAVASRGARPGQTKTLSRSDKVSAWKKAIKRA